MDIDTTSDLLPRPPAETVHDAEELTRFLSKACYRDLIVVSNREPCVHSLVDGNVVGSRPAGGLVTALEAVVTAAGGCWIAHGSGDADRLLCDRRDRVRLPLATPSFTLRRLWLSEAEVGGYYEGFANEGIWPLCHVAHVRPVFRDEDWRHYRRVNQRFADAVVAEARTARPVVFVQDYHLALVPQMVRAVLPDAVIVTFWHIPWPARDMLEICPWHREIVAGLSGSSVIGFQTPRHRDNFEAAIAPDSHRRNAEVVAVACPISIAWPQQFAPDSVVAAGASVRVRFALPSSVRLLLGVDRLDYTKGIVERLAAFERLLETYPHLLGQVTLLQIAAPTRIELEVYRRLEGQVRALAARINDRFGVAGYAPVSLQLSCHDAETLTHCYMAADACLVTSLHDGMNLVAKEFVAARSDNGGVLVLSEFTGAARELRGALVVNPYSCEAMAAAMAKALAMPRAEQARRMRAMRATVSRHTVFGWAATLLSAGVTRHAADGAHGVNVGYRQAAPVPYQWQAA